MARQAANADRQLSCLLLPGHQGNGTDAVPSIIGGPDTASTGDTLIEGERVVGPGSDPGMVFQGYALFAH